MFKAFTTLFSGNLIGKILGIFREALLANFFGTSTPTGAFRAAQSATFIPINFFTSDSLNAGFIPLYSKFLKENKNKSQAFFWIMFILLFLLSIGISFILYLNAEIWIKLLVPGFGVYASKMTIAFLKIMSIGIPFYVISLLLTFLEIGNNGYKLASLRPSIQSFGLIIGTILAFNFKNPNYLAWGFTGSYIFFLFFCSLRLYNLQLLYFPEKAYFKYYKEILNQFWLVIRPLLLLPFLLQGNIAIERVIASMMGIEVVASLDYAKFITETGIVLVAAPIGLIGLAELSKIPKQDIIKKLNMFLPVIIITTIPLSAYLFIESDLIVKLLFGRGEFNENSITITSDILKGLSIGFWATLVSYILIKVLNAQFSNKQVIIYTSISLGINSLFIIFLYKFFGVITLGIGASIYAVFLFIFCSLYLGIFMTLTRYIIILIPGLILYLIVTCYVITEGWVGLLLSVAIFLFYWILYVFSIPILREVVKSFIYNIKKL